LRSAFVLLMCVSLSVTSVAVGALADGPGYEVWLIDQSDTRSDGGGTLYVYPGDAVSGLDAASAVPEVIDLGGAARDRCLAETGSAPRRPHMLDFDARHEVAIISFVAAPATESPLRSSVATPSRRTPVVLSMEERSIAAANSAAWTGADSAVDVRAASVQRAARDNLGIAAGMA